MLLELQIKYLRQMEKRYIEIKFEEPIFENSIASCLCPFSRFIGGFDFTKIVLHEARQYCEANKIKIPELDNKFWFKINKEGFRVRKLIIRAIRKRKEALLKECVY